MIDSIPTNAPKTIHHKQILCLRKHGINLGPSLRMPRRRIGGQMPRLPVWPQPWTNQYLAIPRRFQSCMWDGVSKTDKPRSG
ncbi:hypothetical protein I7I48_07652 [Histoplasma ohiense]|nr:hypothetical protein I7I48_07652 [Histoplasma ohiense (nom. inval.)]